MNRRHPSPTATATLLAALLLAPAKSASASDVQPPPRGTEGRDPEDGPAVFRAVRTATPPNVDGRLGDAVWEGAPPIEGFRQRTPNEGAEASQRTVVRVLYDDHALYVGARLYDTAPDSIVARLVRRDAEASADVFYVALDPYHDRRSGYYFGINAAGTLYDGVLVNDGGDDDAWDGVWTGRATRDGEGWAAELKIPYSQLRFRPADVQVWGINFRRDIARHNEQTFLHVVPSTETGFVSHFPDLVGIERIRPGRGVEVVPYVTSRATLTDAGEGDPFDDGSEFQGEAGADLRLGLTSNLTLNATLNPDFGQVEVDPAVVNLSAFETFFPERRPFFVEGSSVFEFGYGGSGRNYGWNWVNLDPFYSRRIGRSPTGSLPDHDYAAVPDATRILGAAKVTGRVGATNVGLVSSLTGRAEARLMAGGAESEAEVEPLAHYGVARALREFDDGARGLGLLATATNRDIRDEAQGPSFNTGAYSTGVDGWTRFGGGEWVLKGWFSGSHVVGDAERILRLQRSSIHYLQRPDRRSFQLDSSRTSLTGWASRLSVDKLRGNWMTNVALGLVSPTYDINDVGFLGRTDIINSHAFVGHHAIHRAGGIFRNHWTGAALFGSLNFDGQRISNGFWARGEGEFQNFWYAGIGFFAGLPALDQYATRGGPLVRNPGGYTVEYNASTDGRKPWQLSLYGNSELSPTGPGHSGSVELAFQPRPNVSLSVGPELSRIVNVAQYVTTEDDALATHTFGRRYVFARLEQWQTAANLRLNWTFSPTMSLQLFAQPLLASGAYEGYKELAAPRTYTFNPYTSAPVGSDSLRLDPDGEAGPAASFTLDRPDFRFVSLRGNAVFRWEYRPGSTLFLVWTQQREDSETDGRFLLGQGTRRLFDVRPDNVFALKLTYWIGR